MVVILPAYLRGGLADNVQSLLCLQAEERPEGIPLGAACSGSDCCTPALDMFFDVLARDGGFEDIVCQATSCRVNVDVKWACKKAPVKQRWLEECTLFSKIFKDIRTISQGYARTTESEEKEKIDDVLLYSCGFSCQSVSKQNSNNKDYEGCCTTGVGESGMTYKASNVYIGKHLPMVLFLENVGDLSTKDRARAKKDLEMLGYRVIVLQSNALACGLPVHRDRVWLIAAIDIPDRYILLHAQDLTARRAFHSELGQRGEQIVAQRLEYLVIDGDPNFRMFKDVHLQDKCPCKKTDGSGFKNAGKKSRFKWIIAHRMFWKTIKKTDLPCNQQGRRSKPTFSIHFKVSPREADVLKMCASTARTTPWGGLSSWTCHSLVTDTLATST